MSGVSSTKFSPNSAADRAMLVTILHRTAGKPAADGGVSFADVPGGKYYSAAVSWAAGEGLCHRLRQRQLQPHRKTDAGTTRRGAVPLCAV